MTLRTKGSVFGLWMLVLPVIMLVAWTGGAEAQTAHCQRLENRLAELSSSGRSPDFAKYDRAVKQQMRQLDIAFEDARQLRCRMGGIQVFGLTVNSSQCRALMVTIDRMERNLSELESRRDELAGGSLAERARILASLEINGCQKGKSETASRNLDQSVSRSEEPAMRSGEIPAEQKSVLDKNLEQNARRAAPNESTPLEPEPENRLSNIINNPEAGPLAPMGQTYRTLCVRTCDGYYFPVSHSATELQFGNDQSKCEAMCPGTEVKLYYHKATGEESEDMISLGGEPYSQLPAAFSYRKADFVREKSCGCSPVKEFSVIAGDTKKPEPTSVTPVIPVPVARPDPAADPETLANRDGGLTPDAIRRVLTPPPSAEATDTPGSSKVRVVGPVFLPDPEAAIDLQVQDPRSVR